MLARNAPIATVRAALLGALLLAPNAASAQNATTPGTRESATPSNVSPEDRKQAGHDFAEGTRAFDAGDFVRAAELFEAAYRLAPHEDALWNAARARHRAGDLALAANLYAKYLRKAPPTARDRGGATAALAALGTKLARLELHVATGVHDVMVDGAPVDEPVIYVPPGTHAVTANGEDGDVIDERPAVHAGDVVSVALGARADAKPAVVGTPAPPSSAPKEAAPPHVELAPPPEPPHRRGWSPAVLLPPAAATLILGGVTTWSALDTLSALHSFEATPTQKNLDDGRAKQTRTNVLLGTSIGLAAVTTIAAVWLIDWHGGSSHAEVGLGLGSASVRGSF